MDNAAKEAAFEGDDRLELQPVSGEGGQSLAEYALIVMFIALACVGALTALGPVVAQSYQDMVGYF